MCGKQFKDLSDQNVKQIYYHVMYYILQLLFMFRINSFVSFCFVLNPEQFNDSTIYLKWSLSIAFVL